jgi:hypothetical protein
MRRPLVLAIALVLPAASAAAPRRVLPLPIVAEGVTAAVVADVQGAVDDALARLSGIERVPAAGPTFCAATDARCIADAGKRAGADQVLHVSARPVGDTISLLLVLVNTRDAAAARVPAELRAGTGAGPVVRPALVRLLAPERFVGALQVEAPAGSEIWVDGVRAATAPAAPVAGLTPGQHLVRVVTPGGEERRYVEVRFEETTTVRAGATTAAPEERGGALPAVRVALLAGGGAALIAGVLAATSASAIADDHAAAARTPVTDGARVQDLAARYDARRTLATALYVTSGVLLAGAGTLYALDLFPARSGAGLALRGSW